MLVPGSLDTQLRYRFIQTIASHTNKDRGFARKCLARQRRRGGGAVATGRGRSGGAARCCDRGCLVLLARLWVVV